MNGAKLDKTGKYAVAGGNEEIIHLCKQNNSSFENGYYVAIKFHKNIVFKYLYENKIQEDDLESLGRLCISYNNYELLSFLIKEGMKIKDSLIHSAANIGNLYLVKYFVQNHQIPNILYSSSISGNVEIVKYVLDQNINIEKSFYYKILLFKNNN